jgi:hypothetical protein
MGDCRFRGKFVVGRLTIPFSLLPERLILVLQRRITGMLEHEMVLRGPSSRDAPRLRSYVAGVEGASNRRVFCAFEDGAAVGEDGHFVGVDAEAEQEIVMADVVNR